MESNLLPESEEEDIIRIKDLKVWTAEEKSWLRRKVTKPKTVILNSNLSAPDLRARCSKNQYEILPRESNETPENGPTIDKITCCYNNQIKVSGSISNGEFLAVIGPSGAGKTTLLISLAGKCTLSSEGEITVRGRNVRCSQGVVEMTPQLDVFMESLTVMEHLIFMTEMKLGCSKNLLRKNLLEDLMYELKLKKHAHTQISNLSGGERRLLSLAGSLLSEPEILICDEPTTGLDSYNAALVVGVLKKIALSGKIVICSVHQPSSVLFKEFSSVMLMAEGSLLFHGTLEECREVFESMNQYCPKNYNAAEFYIRAVSNSSNESCSRRLMEISRERSKAYSNRTGFGEPTKSLNTCQRNWFKQVQLLLWRTSLTVRREIKDFMFQLFVCLGISAIVLATCYSGISGTTQRGVQDLRGFLWLVCSETMFTLSYNALYIFESELTLFRREVGVYSVSAYFVARFLCIIPRCVIWPVSLVTVATLTVELPNHIMTSLEFMLALIVASFAATAYGLGMGALFTSTNAMGDIMPCADLPLFLMSGAFLRMSSLPIWLQPLKFISHFYYAMDALSNIYWRQIPFIDCPSNSTGPLNCVTDGTAVLIENGYSKDFILLDSLGLTLVTLIWSILAYYGLKREEKKGYAY